VELFSAIGREYTLREAISSASIREDYDFILIDSPPTLGLLTINSSSPRTASSSPSRLSTTPQGPDRAGEGHQHDPGQAQSRPSGPGLLPTFYDGRTVLAREMLDELRELGDHHVFRSIVRTTVKLGEAPLTGRPITAYAGHSEAARTFRELAKEVVELGQA